MALKISRGLVCAASRLLTSNQGPAIARMSTLGAVRPTLVRRGLTHSSTRSFWHLASVGSARYEHGTAIPCTFTKTCGCGMHTQGDKEVADFLKEEIEMEKKEETDPGKMPTMTGFDVSVDGTDITLTKEINGDKIKVSFNVNHSVDDGASFNYDEQQQQQTNEPEHGKMMSRPDFTVEITKNSEQTLMIQCSFTDPNDMPAEGQEDSKYIDAVEIQEVSIFEKGTQFDDKVYCVDGSVMDGDLYDLFFTILEERGIDGEFLTDLAEFSTAFEHKQYITFLEGFKKFALSK